IVMSSLRATATNRRTSGAGDAPVTGGDGVVTAAFDGAGHGRAPGSRNRATDVAIAAKEAVVPTPVTYPGVYIQEVPSGVRTITGVATSITAFIGRALRGPVDEPTRVQNFGEFERRFGGLWRDSALGYAVRQFFLNGGGDALIVRVDNGGAKARFELATSGDDLVLDAASPGAWGDNLRVVVDYDTRPLSVEEADLVFNLTILEV